MQVCGRCEESLLKKEGQSRKKGENQGVKKPLDVIVVDCVQKILS